MKSLDNSELMQQAAEWISDSISAHYEFGGDAPGENDGKRLCGELYERAKKARLMGNGEGHTVLILTQEECRLLREWLTNWATCDDPFGKENRPSGQVLKAFNRGIQRGTDKLKAEFDDEQKRRKSSKTRG